MLLFLSTSGLLIAVAIIVGIFYLIKGRKSGSINPFNDGLILVVIGIASIILSFYLKPKFGGDNYSTPLLIFGLMAAVIGAIRSIINNNKTKENK